MLVLALIGYFSGALCYWVLNKNELNSYKKTTEIQKDNQASEQDNFSCKF